MSKKHKKMLKKIKKDLVRQVMVHHHEYYLNAPATNNDCDCPNSDKAYFRGIVDAYVTLLSTFAPELVPELPPSIQSNIFSYQLVVEESEEANEYGEQLARSE